MYRPPSPGIKMQMLVLCSLVFWFKFMGDCPHCHLFSGVPTCAACKTYFRVGSLLKEGGLSRFQETAVLTALRNCAGALSDLTEVSVGSPFGGVGASGSAKTKEPEIGPNPLNEEPEKEEKVEEEEKSPEEEKSSKEEKKSKKNKASEGKKVKVTKKERKKAAAKERERRAKRKSPSKERKSPVVGERTSRDRGSALESRGSREAHSEDLRDRSLPRRRDREERDDRRSREEDPDVQVRRDPARFGLEPIPIRGSAGRHFEGTIPGRSQRPAEPIDPTSMGTQHWTFKEPRT